MRIANRLALLAAFAAASVHGQIATTVTISAVGSQSAVNATVELSNPAGNANTVYASLLINNDMNASGGCTIVYYPNSGDLVYLHTDDALAWVQPSPQAIPTGAPLQNSQCKVYPANSTVSRTANTITLTLRIDFDPSFKGPMSAFSYAGDSATNTQYSTAVTNIWTAFDAIPGSLPSVAISAPLPAADGSGGNFHFQISDPNGYGHLTWVNIIFTPDINGPAVTRCDIWYRPVSNLAVLAVNGEWMPLTLQQPGTRDNQTCQLDGGGSGHVKAGLSVTLNLALGFKAAAAGPMNVHSHAESRTAQTGWQAIQYGNVNYVYTVSATPAVLAVTPNATTTPAASQTFQIRTWNPGAANTGGSDPGDQITFALSYSPYDPSAACWVLYYPQENLAYLMADNGISVSAGPPQPLGAGGLPLNNSQCQIDTAGSSVSWAGNELVVNLKATFQPAFIGSNYIYTKMHSGATGQQSQLVNMGSWTAYAAPSSQPALPGPTPVSPANGSGTRTTFTFQATAGFGNGYKYLTWTSPLISADINFSGTPTNRCDLLFRWATGLLILVPDSGEWIGATIGDPSALPASNNNCTVYPAQSSFSGTGDTLTLNLAVVFVNDPAHQGTKNIHFYVGDRAGDTGWPVVGTYNVYVVAPAKATLTVPVNNAHLAGSPVMFNWGGGAGVTQYKLEVWTNLNGNNIASAATMPPETSGQLVSVPMDGSIVYSRLGSLVNGTWQYDSRQFTAATAMRAELKRLDPPPISMGSSNPMLTSDTVTFYWNAGAGVSEYSFDYECAGHPFGNPVNTNGNTSFTISGIPKQGVAMININLRSYIGTGVYLNTYTYQVWDGIYRSVIKLPVPGVSICNGSQSLPA